MNPTTHPSKQLDSQLMLSALERLRGTGVEFNDFLSNHGPMAADAMIRLGGDRVEAWVDEYRLQLTPDADPGDRVTTDNWREQLGRFDRVGDWTSHFRRAMLDQGWRTVLDTWWDRLLPGAAASATHGLIRTAHAVRNLADGDDTEPMLLDELAHGLALWAARYQLLPGHPRLDGTRQIDDALARLPRLDAHAPSAGPGLTGRLATLFQLEGVPDAIDDWGPTEEPVVALDELIAAWPASSSRERLADRVLSRRDRTGSVRMIIPAIAPRGTLRRWQRAGRWRRRSCPPLPLSRTRFRWISRTSMCRARCSCLWQRSNTATITCSSSPRPACANSGSHTMWRC